MFDFDLDHISVKSILALIFQIQILSFVPLKARTNHVTRVSELYFNRFEIYFTYLYDFPFTVLAKKYIV